MSYGHNKKQYTIGDADEILRGVNKNKLIFTRHSFKREYKRDINENYVKKVLLEIDPLDITQDNRNNEFKLYYPSENYQNKELIVVIAIDDNENVIIQSVWEEKRYK